MSCCKQNQFLLPALLLLCPLSDSQGAEKTRLRVNVEYHRIEDEFAKGLVEIKDPASGKKVFMHPDVEVGTEDIEDLRVAEDEQGRPTIEMRFKKEAAEKVKRFTTRQKDKRIAVLIDSKVVSVAVVAFPFSTAARLTGQFTKEEAGRMIKGKDAK